MLALGAEIFGRIHAEIAERLGDAQLEALEAALNRIANQRSPKLGDVPGWHGPAEIVVDPAVPFGYPVIKGAGARVKNVLDRFCAGEALRMIADDLPASVK